MSFAKKSFQLGQMCRQHLSTTRAKAAAGQGEIKIVNYSKMKAKQEHFQINDDVPVFLKGGIADKLLYQATAAMCVLGVGVGLHYLYDTARKK